MKDISEPLKRIYLFLDSLERIAGLHEKNVELVEELTTIHTGIKSYLDDIAKSVDYI